MTIPPINDTRLQNDVLHFYKPDIARPSEIYWGKIRLTRYLSRILGRFYKLKESFNLLFTDSCNYFSYLPNEFFHSPIIKMSKKRLKKHPSDSLQFASTCCSC